MPITYEIDTENKRIHTRCIGNVTLEDGFEHLRVLTQDPNRPDLLNVLLDLSETVTVPESDDLRVIGEELKRASGILRINAMAVVVPNDHLFGMSRMFLVFAREGIRSAHVFRTFNNANLWLDSFEEWKVSV